MYAWQGGVTMPVYEFACRSCGARFDKRVLVDHRDHQQAHHCHVDSDGTNHFGVGERVFTADFAFRIGSGGFLNGRNNVPGGNV